MTTSPTRSINDLSRIYLTQVSEGKDNPYSIKNKLKMAIKSVAEKERAKAGVTREEVENIDEKCWDGYEKKGMKTMFGKRYPNCVKKKAKKEDFSNWRDDLSDIVEVMDMTDDKAEKKIDDKKRDDLLKSFLNYNKDMRNLSKYFEKYRLFLLKSSLNLFTKGVIKTDF